jgi:hypothetical protein
MKKTVKFVGYANGLDVLQWVFSLGSNKYRELRLGIYCMSDKQCGESHKITISVTAERVKP